MVLCTLTRGLRHALATEVVCNMNHEPGNCLCQFGVSCSVRNEPSPRIGPAKCTALIRYRNSVFGRIANKMVFLLLGSIFAIVWSDSSRATSCHDHAASKTCLASAEIVHRSGANIGIKVSYEPVEKCAKIRIHLAGMKKYRILENYQVNIIERFVNEDALWGVKSPVYITKKIDLPRAVAGAHDQEYIDSEKWGTPAGIESSSGRMAKDIGSLLGEDMDSLIDGISVRKVECKIYYSENTEQTADEEERERLAREEERKRLALERREEERKRLLQERREEERKRLAEQRRDEERQRLADLQPRERERQWLADQQRRERERQRLADLQRKERERQRLADLQRKERERQWLANQQRRERERQRPAQERGGAQGLEDFLAAFTTGMAIVQGLDEVFGDGGGSPGYIGSGLESGSVTEACQQAQMSASRQLASRSFSGLGSQCTIYRSHAQMVERMRRELASAGCPAYALAEYDRVIAEARRGAAMVCN